MQTTHPQQLAERRSFLPAVLITALALGTTILLWAAAFVGIRSALPAYGAFHLAALRFLIAMVVMLVVAVVARVRLPERRDLGRIFALGVVGISVYNIALNLGEVEVDAGIASLLVNTSPIWTSLTAQLLLGERLRWLGWLGIAVGFTGAATIALGPGSQIQFSWGVLLIIIAALVHGLYSVIQKPLFQRYRPVEVTTYTIIAGALGLLPFGWGLPTTIMNAPLSSTLAVIFLAVGPAALAYGTWSVVLSRMPAARAASFLYLVSPTAIIIAWIWLGETPTITTLIGGALALLGVSIVARSRQAH